jgi:hypothetical protein
LTLAVHRIYASEFNEADRILTGEIQSGSAFRVQEGLWFRAISLRYQGRLGESYAAARQLRLTAVKPYRRVIAQRQALPIEAAAEAQALLEMGRFRQAAAVFDSISRWVVGDESPSQRAHNRVWQMAHAAGALAAAGDTAGLVARIDTIQIVGRESGNGRDRLLHRYVRGLLFAARGLDEAAVAEFRGSIQSWNFGYTRANLALAESLMRLGRPGEAVLALQPALRGNLESSNFYTNRTEVHEQLARAWDAVGGPAARDSAAAHYAYVERAWSQADSTFFSRLRHVSARREALAKM